MGFADRIKKLHRVPARALMANPKNWRKHPAGQRGALREALAQVGIANALIAYRGPEGLTLIDGHLRADMDPDQKWPVLELDVTEAEADVLLATLDPLAALADADAQKLAELLPTLAAQGEYLAAVLADLAADNGLDGLLAADDTPALTEAEDDWDWDDDAADPAAAGPSADSAAAEREASHVRMVQLFLTEANIGWFQDAVHALAREYGTQNVTDTVVEAVRRAVDAPTPTEA